MRSRSRCEGRKISKSGRGVLGLVGMGVGGGESRGSKSAMRRGFPGLWLARARVVQREKDDDV